MQRSGPSLGASLSGCDKRSRRSAARLVCLLCLLCFVCLLLAPAEQPALVRFAVIGDSGTGDNHQYEIARQMAAWHDRLPFDLVLMLGDNVYGGLAGLGGGNKKDFEEKFDRPYAELLRRGVVFRAALGNHDLRHRDGRDLIEARERFHIDGPQGYYSFTAGTFSPPPPSPGAPAPGNESAPLVEFFVLNTVRLEKDKQDAEQLAWLERALAASRARWRIVYGHHPLYSTGKRHGGDVALREKLEPLLLGEAPVAGATGLDHARFPGAGALRLRSGQAPGLGVEGGSGAVAGQNPTGVGPRVQVVLAGHDHIYQRFHTQKGIAYFVCGASGKLRRGNAQPSSLVAAVEDEQQVFMLWEATPEGLRYRGINEKGEAFDCGLLGPAGQWEAVTCQSGPLTKKIN